MDPPPSTIHAAVVVVGSDGGAVTYLPGRRTRNAHMQHILPAKVCAPATSAHERSDLLQISDKIRSAHKAGWLVGWPGASVLCAARTCTTRTRARTVTIYINPERDGRACARTDQTKTAPNADGISFVMYI